MSFHNFLSNPLSNSPRNPIADGGLSIAAPLLRSRVGRMAWSLFAHPVQNREFPAEHERLVTPEDLMMYGFWGNVESA